MLSFLLDEGVVTVGVLSGLFTTGLLNSFKLNILDPTIEKIIPSHKLDTEIIPIIKNVQNIKDVPIVKENVKDVKNSQSNFANIFPIPIGTPEQTNLPKNVLKWQTFLKDFITWLIVMFIFYLFWKFVLVPRKMNKNV